MPKVKISANKEVKTQGEFVKVGQKVSGFSQGKAGHYTITHFLPGVESPYGADLTALQTLISLSQMEYPYKDTIKHNPSGRQEDPKPSITVFHVQKREAGMEKSPYYRYLEKDNINRGSFTEQQLANLKLRLSSGSTGKACGVVIADGDSFLKGTFVPAIVVVDSNNTVVYAQMTTDMCKPLDVKSMHEVIQKHFLSNVLLQKKKAGVENDEWKADFDISDKKAGSEENANPDKALAKDAEEEVSELDVALALAAINSAYEHHVPRSGDMMAAVRMGGDRMLHRLGSNVVESDSHDLVDDLLAGICDLGADADDAFAGWGDDEDLGRLPKGSRARRWS